MADKAPYRTVHVKLPLELIEALRAMGRACPALPRKLSSTIETALLWAVWAHSHGRGPDVEMARLEGGYNEWNENISVRARREIKELDRLFETSDPSEPDQGS